MNAQHQKAQSAQHRRSRETNKGMPAGVATRKQSHISFAAMSTPHIANILSQHPSLVPWVQQTENDTVYSSVSSSGQVAPRGGNETRGVTYAMLHGDPNIAEHSNGLCIHPRV